VLTPTPDKEQFDDLKIPFLLVVKLTIPPGVDGARPRSVTVTTQSLPRPSSTEEAHVTDVEVGSLMKMMTEGDGGEEP